MIVMVVGAIIGGLSILSGGYEEKNNTLRNEAATVTAEAKKFEDKYAKVQQNMNLYKESVAKIASGRLTISHQSVGEVFNRLNDKFYLANLHLTMSGIDDIKNPSFKRKDFGIVSSEVIVTFQALSDEYVYAMLDQMQKDLAGSARLTKLTLKREGDITDSVLQAIVQRGTYPLVSAEIKFLWFGLKPIEAKPADANGVKQKN